jgi:1-acyl-sn-glycerol-3-phosphate acyltransferase
VKKRGNVVLEFLEPIPPGLRPREFMKVLEDRIEQTTTLLVAEGRKLLDRRNP